MIGIIGGSGLYCGMKGLENRKECIIDTAFGTVKYMKATLAEMELVFISRHGFESKLPPHKINYKANISALKTLGVTQILATSAVGTLDETIPLGTLVLPDQFIDFTRENRTFYEGGDSGLVHLNLQEPFCPELRRICYDCGRTLALDIVTSGTYTCIDGPHFETLAEARMLAMLGGTLAGMTAVPEAKLARELEMCYQVVAIPVDYPTTIGSDISHENTIVLMEKATDNIARLFESVAGTLSAERNCVCARALEGSLQL